MIRTTLLWMLVMFLAGYAWRDWYKSLCGLILLMAVVQHPDFPNSVLGIHGLNPWNVLLAIVVFAWLAARKNEGLTLDAPPAIIWLLVVFFFFIVLAFVRLTGNTDELREYATAFGVPPPSAMYLFSEYIINCLKWVVPAFLLYDGCRDEKRLRLALLAVLTMYILLAVQVIRWMPLGMLTSGEELSRRGLKILVNEVGYHRVNISMMLAGASWALYAVRDLPRHYLVRLACLFFAGVLLFALALTGGRMGLATWGVLGVIFSAWKWRKLMIIGPAIALVLILAYQSCRHTLRAVSSIYPRQRCTEPLGMAGET